MSAMDVRASAAVCAPSRSGRAPRAPPPRASDGAAAICASAVLRMAGEHGRNVALAERVRVGMPLEREHQLASRDTPREGACALGRLRGPRTAIERGLNTEGATRGRVVTQL